MRVARKTRKERKRTIVHITDLRTEEYPLQLGHPREDLLQKQTANYRHEGTMETIMMTSSLPLLGGES